MMEMNEEHTPKKMKKSMQTPSKMKNKDQIPNSNELVVYDAASKQQNSRLKRGTIDIYAAQCGKCFKWRTIESQDEYEEIRFNFKEKPFYCDKKALSCETPGDIEYDDTRVWALDKPSIPKTPKGFKRELILRRDFSRLDAFYLTPTGKRVRSSVEAASFLKENYPKFKEAKSEDFNFAVPRVMDDTVPENDKVGLKSR